MLKNKPKLHDTIWYYMTGKDVIGGKLEAIDYLTPQVTFVSIRTPGNKKINMNINDCFDDFKTARAYQIAWECSQVKGIIDSKHYKKEELEHALDEFGYLFI